VKKVKKCATCCALIIFSLTINIQLKIPFNFVGTLSYFMTNSYQCKSFKFNGRLRRKKCKMKTFTGYTVILASLTINLPQKVLLIIWANNDILWYIYIVIKPSQINRPHNVANLLKNLKKL
jgi:hypothetical protein